MYPIPPHEHLVETRTCKHCQTPFPITDKDIEMLEKLSPKVGERRISLPVPMHCPHCRKVIHYTWRNERKLYKRKCDATGKDIISMFRPDIPYTVYEDSYWDSDRWSAKDFGREYDFSRPFFEQFHDLQKGVPLSAMAKTDSLENSEYCNNGSYAKNNYLCFGYQNIENCYYSTNIWYCSGCVDSHCVYNSEFLYECIMAFRSYNVRFSYDIKNCRDSEFLLSCEGCSNCYGCFGLINKQYSIFNTPYKKEEYEKKLSEIKQQPYTKQKRVFHDFYEKKYSPLPLPNIGSENTFSSRNVIQSHEITLSNDLQNCENIRYSSVLSTTKLALDYHMWGTDTEKVYHSTQVGNHSHSLYFCAFCNENISELFYCFLCRNGVNNCFGCIGLRSAESYCILNKQYTKEEYEILVPKIIDHMMKTPHPDPLRGGEGVTEWGEFFPPHFSPFGYNESASQILEPLTKEEALAKGFNWSDYEPPFPRVEKIIPANKLPDDISKIPDDILNWAIECEVTKKPFRIIPQELAFYRKHNIPIPRRHPDQRHLDRMAQRNPRKLYERLCDCPNCEENAKKSGSYREKEFDFRDPETRSGGQRRKMITTYAPERPETVYCEVCYEREI